MGRMHTSKRRDEVEITLSSRVQTLVEAQVKQAGYPNASALIEEAVLRLFEHGEARVDLESSPREGIKRGPEEEVCPEPLRSDILQEKSQKPGSLLAFSWDESSARQFHLESLSAVRNEADKLKDQIGAIERYVLFGSGAIYTFLVAHSNDLKSVPLANYVWWIPPTMTWLFGLRSLALRRRLKSCDSYIDMAEDELKVGQLCGARHWYRKKERRLQCVTAVALVVWLL